MTIAAPPATLYDAIEEAGKRLYIKALTDIPQDVRAGLKRGHDTEVSAGNKTASKVMLTVLENIKLADDKDMMVCQDTGLPIYKVLVGNDLARRGLDMVEIKKRLKIAAERATKQIAASALTERCRAVGGDFFKAVPEGGDAYLLKHVIHDWNDEQAVAILRSCHRAMPATGKLLIVEGVYPPRIDQSLESRGAAANDVNMLVNTGGRQRSEAEFRSLYDAAGFTLTRIVPTPARVAVIEGTRQPV